MLRNEGGGRDVLVCVCVCVLVRYWGFDGICVRALKVCVGACVGIYG